MRGEWAQSSVVTALVVQLKMAAVLRPSEVGVLIELFAQLAGDVHVNFFCCSAKLESGGGGGEDGGDDRSGEHGVRRQCVLIIDYKLGGGASRSLIGIGRTYI